MTDSQRPQPDYDTIARQAYEWLKKRRAIGEISTFVVLMKINGYKWESKELEQLEELNLFEVHNRLLRLIRKEKEYVGDSAYKKICLWGCHTISLSSSARNRASAYPCPSDGVAARGCVNGRGPQGVPGEAGHDAAGGIGPEARIGRRAAGMTEGSGS